MPIQAVISPVPTRATTPRSIVIHRTPSVSLSPHRHNHYYLEDGVIFLVENTLFKVPRYMLVRESPVFADMFGIPTSGLSEGKTDTSPIHLLQVKAIDFERVLELLYPTCFSKFTTTTVAWGENEWKSILHLASRWQMHEVRSVAIARLSSCATPTTKITLGRQYDHAVWIRDGFLNLCLRKEPLTMEDAVLLSLEEILGVASARERFRSEIMEPNYQGTLWRHTKYGECAVREMDYGSPETYIRNEMVHHILDETFCLGEEMDTMFKAICTPSPPAPGSPVPHF